MNKLIERLENMPVFIVQAYSKDGQKIPFAIHDTDYVRNERVDMGRIIEALEAADRMAKVASDTLKWPGDIDFMGMNDALTAYRKLTQETPHAKQY